MATKSDHKVHVAASTAPVTLFSAPALDIKDDTQGVAHLDQLLQDLTYSGFKPAELRDTMKTLLEPKEVATLVAAYVQIGNNVEAAEDKRRAKPNASIRPLLKKSKTTLARLAIAYMPLTYLLRTRGVKKGWVASRFPESPVPAELQDVAFAGWKGANLLDFLIRFDAALSNTGEQDQHGRDNVVRWMNIAVAGFERDVSVKTVLSKALTEKDILQWFDAQFTE